MRPILSGDAPKPIGPYSQAIDLDPLVFCSGQIAIDPATGALVEGDITKQTAQVLKNVSAVLEAAGLRFEDVVKTTVFLLDMADFPAMNQIYAEAFGTSKPARSTVAVAALPMGSRVEIEVIARRS